MAPGGFLPSRLSQKSLKKRNHEEHKEELFFSFVAFVFFVVQGFYAFCDSPFAGMMTEQCLAI